ncbi:hypothetical protein PAXRUDRAFT_149183 [Paxillus rubicundulus Ve08.2h10]|uniref:Uncharacterized protein n=1 Tax=Paxillus rubicundulus Ve08.2h10 TaxID=930991 RepID=A0A0D0DYB7_9AGAM|nr:hypothetical protein PAXRUDRAFT_149183 [Paxillus rubicundulus Ve08.2h10]
MLFNSTQYRETVACKTNYAARPSLANNLEWRPDGMGHAVFQKDEDDPFTTIVIGKVVDYRLNAGPGGTFLNPDFGPIQKAKYQFYLTRPVDAAFREDFDRTYAFLDGLQNTITKGQNKKNMLINEAGGKMIRFSRNIFEKRVKFTSNKVRSKYLALFRRSLCVTPQNLARPSIMPT